MRFPGGGEQFGAYRLVRELGRGGFAAVFLAHDERVDREVAIKMLLPQSDLHREDVEARFMREARVIAQLQHPHNITMYDFGRSDDGLLFMVFEHVAGQDLTHVLNHGPLPPAVVIQVMTQLLGALVEAHSYGVLHRDIKPGNILVFAYMDNPYHAKLIDYGIAKPLIERTGEPTYQTQEGMVVGTPRYMAPEQFFGDQLTPAADLYSLGLVAHQMLRGEHPIDAEDGGAIMRRQLSPEPIRLPAHCAPPSLAAWVDKMTARDAEDRYPTAVAALHALSRVDLHESGGARPVASSGARRASSPSASSASSVSPRSSKARVMLGAGAIGALAGLALFGAFAVLSSPEEAPQPDALPPSVTQATPAINEIVVESLDVGSPDTSPVVVDASAPANGCGREFVAGRSRRLGLNIGHRRRTWVAHLPRRYDSNEPHPLVLMFHRTSRSGESFLSATTFARLADKKGFIALSFDAFDSRAPWSEVDDVEFVRAAIESTSMDACVDRRRIYVLGDGSGGRFARNLPCQLPVSAVATTASGQHPGEAVCDAKPPTPFLRLYGANDLDVPASGGPGCLGGRDFLSANDIGKGWRERNGCHGAKRTWKRVKKSRCETWSCEAPFVHCALDGGHDWPGATAPFFKFPGCAAEPPDFPLAETVWEFYVDHGRTLSD